MCRVLQEDPSLDLQAYVVPAVAQRSIHNRNKQHVKASALSPIKSVSLSVILYGPMEILDFIGEILSQCSEYLQPPLRCNRNVPYMNPQSLFRRDGAPLTTFQLQSELSLSSVEAMDQNEDPSAVLETEDSLPETEAPAVIRTTLYSHQKRALSFMLMRESNIAPDSKDGDSWQTVPSGIGGLTKYKNIETGRITMYHPGEVRGGILADAMGLGKTLSVISLIATGWSRRTQSSVGFIPTILVVQPSLLQTWEKELRTHLRPQTLRFWRYHGPKRADDVAAMLAHDIVVTTYDVFAREWRGLDNGLKPLYLLNWHGIILDEGNSRSSTTTTHSDLSDLAHEIRAGTTLKAKAIYGLRGNTRWAISGTPIQNRWEDLASLLKFIRVFLDSDLKSIRAMLTLGSDDSPVRSLLASICLRRSKNAIHLPNRTDRIHRVEFEDHEAIYYKSINDSVRGLLHNDTGSSHLAIYSNILRKINALRQICNLGVNYQAQLRTSPVLEEQDIKMRLGPLCRRGEQRGNFE
ncbi:hypothetical protein N7G274_000957 [Stereocaulon virgatum]|uniref:Helicase ATP-binding domain-containing protein n=1 Tax=Stereocaulon virgatum TaxID=373712 RepID=A0ABR4AQM4_9LECA